MTPRIVLAAIFGGQLVSQNATWAPWFTWSAMTLAGAIIFYGFVASALPVWLLLAPRDYLSTFVKLGVVIMLGLGVVFAQPVMNSSALCFFFSFRTPSPLFVCRHILFVISY